MTLKGQEKLRIKRGFEGKAQPGRIIKTYEKPFFKEKVLARRELDKAEALKKELERQEELKNR